MTTETNSAYGHDPFADLSKLRLDQNFADTVGVKKLLRTVPIKKPSPQDFVRLHPELQLVSAPLIELKGDREIYLVLPELAPELPGEFYIATLHLASNRQSVAFLWPTRGPGPDGRYLEWWRSAAEAAELAKMHWIRLRANMALGAYEIFQASNQNIPEPVWPEEPFEEIVKIAFRDKLIDRHDHPVIKRLRGET